MSSLRILLLQFEPTVWSKGRSYPYNLNFGFADGLCAHGVEVIVVTSIWRERLSELCQGERFDQVWINDLSHFAELDYSLDEVCAMAPIRVGFATESLVYSDVETEEFSWLRLRERRLREYPAAMTHIAAVDEYDVVSVRQEYGVPTMWHPVPIPERFIGAASQPPSSLAYFGGSIYGGRGRWLADERVRELVAVQPAPDAALVEAAEFDALQAGAAEGCRGLAGEEVRPALETYTSALREMRRSAAQRWIAGMRRGAAIVNLPHLVKAYSSRVIEGIAAGRPVVSWRVPQRLRNEALFAEGEEILLCSTPDELAYQLTRIAEDREWSAKLVASAQAKARRFHTSKVRAGQLLRWIESGVQPRFSDPRDRPLAVDLCPA